MGFCGASGARSNSISALCLGRADDFDQAPVRQRLFVLSRRQEFGRGINQQFLSGVDPDFAEEAIAKQTRVDAPVADDHAVVH